MIKRQPFEFTKAEHCKNRMQSKPVSHHISSLVIQSLLRDPYKLPITAGAFSFVNPCKDKESSATPTCRPWKVTPRMGFVISAGFNPYWHWFEGSVRS